MKQHASEATSQSARGTSTRKHRRAFDRETGVIIAKDLFHERGYDAVGIAELTRALDINPPSLYAAYGSKVGLFERCLAVYVQEANLPANKILTPDRPMPDAVNDLFMNAAMLYTRSKSKRGCMAAEGMRSADSQARALANAYGEVAASIIERHIRQTQPQRARERSDYIMTTLQGLSASARAGLSRPRIMSVAKLAGQAFRTFVATTQATAYHHDCP